MNKSDKDKVAELVAMMDKTEIRIVNNTNQVMTYAGISMKHGKLADGDSWPSTIQPHTEISVQYYSDSERDGCAGWVEYRTPTPHQMTLFFLFDHNPIHLSKFDVSTSAAIYDNLHPHRYAKKRVFPIQSTQGEYLTIEMTSGGVLDKRSDVTTKPDPSISFEVKEEATHDASLENPKIEDVIKAFSDIPTSGTRLYFSTSSDFSSFHSHFKGVANYEDKLLFTHSDLNSGKNGLCYVGPLQANSNNWSEQIDEVYRIDHSPIWQHSGGAQTCGKFMAMGYQKTAKEDNSEICIYDVSGIPVNEEMTEITKIVRFDDGINGVGITRDSAGYYLVAGNNGPRLKLYRSNSTTLSSKTTFSQVYSSDNLLKDDNGAGMGLITQEDGTIFLVTMHGTERGPSTMNLYKFKLSLNSKGTYYSECVKVNTEAKEMTVQDPNRVLLKVADRINNMLEPIESVPLYGELIDFIKDEAGSIAYELVDAGFRWGKGLAITPEGKLNIYATDRNVLITSKGEAGFSAVTWETA